MRVKHDQRVDVIEVVRYVAEGLVLAAGGV